MNASTLRPRDGESSLVGVFGGFDAPARLAAAQFYLRGCNATQLGRFTLRDEGKTIAIGKIMKIKDPAAARARRAAKAKE